MASQDLKQRIKDEPTIVTSTNNKNNISRREKKMAMAKRGLRSLAIATVIPTFLTFATLYVLGSTHNYQSLAKPFWFPPLWAIHLAYLGSSFLMGLSAWLVWAEGGFHRQPTALPLYLAQLVLCLCWYPIVFTMEKTVLGLIVCVALLGSFFGCSGSFREVNPIAGDLVRPCLAMAAFLAIMNYKLLYL